MSKLHNQIFLALGCLVAAGVYLRSTLDTQKLASQTSEPVTIAEVSTSTTGTTDLELKRDSTSPHTFVGDELSVGIAIGGSDHVTGVQLELVYDPTYLQYVSTTPSSSFPVTLVGATNNSTLGKITATYGAAVQSGGVVGINQLASIRFRVTKAGSTTIRFGDTTLVTGTSRPSGSVLKNVNTLALSPVTLKLGDLTRDTLVNLEDYTALITGYGTTYNLQDYSNIVTNYGK